ncbi:inositol 1,4,5-trisphosphate receptor-interacting protein-like 1, partial [Nyctibius grandis]|uniref:inositol 1,4,5-trisphosphate receptor-interacting protein-like 1 n=1 Tax=Nyctibius grandis TaxID=48427 RepID=UPI0035BBCF6B
MAATEFFAVFVLSIIQLPQMVGDELDEATRERMQQRAEQLSQEMTRLLQELGQRGHCGEELSLRMELECTCTREQHVGDMVCFLHHPKKELRENQGPSLLGTLCTGPYLDMEKTTFWFQTLAMAATKFFAVLVQSIIQLLQMTWQFWAVAGNLVLLFGLFRWLRKRSPHRESSSKGKESSSSLSKEEEEQEESEEGSDSERDMSRIFAKRIHWPVQNLAYRIRVVEELLGELRVLQEPLSKSTSSFFPELQPAIRVGSAFEGWSPCEDDAVYHVLMPLKPPRGHAFHLELGTEQEMPTRNFCVRVEQVCTCMSEQLVENMLCFLHHPEEELRRNQDPSLLRTLCTGSYLDVQKTARWFQSFVMSSWMLLPQSRRYKMKMLPSSRSCKMQLTKSSRTLFIEIMFGVQQGDSDIFVSSQSTEATFTPSTTWPESYAVAEVKFFRHVARQAPHSSYHLRCLQVCARILEGTGF